MTENIEQTTDPASTEVVFHKVCRSGQVPEGYVRRFYVDELECAVARLGGKAYATSNYCTHLDCLLSSGKLQDDGIRCSCHGSVFELEGGQPIYPPATEPIAVYPVREDEGEIYVGVSQADIEHGGPRRRKPRD
ncbi:Rieske (2Fe-2S) protein [Janibacter melonis]|uniref:Rieske (2Fe-2S) protein n=1 Tax=Janibacter melonis TaxID=262209 RepID=UPI0017493B0D|nr:Rieske 2Fe-2S domain-containing protein [Janibacter melonis]